MIISSLCLINRGWEQHKGQFEIYDISPEVIENNYDLVYYNEKTTIGCFCYLQKVTNVEEYIKNGLI